VLWRDARRSSSGLAWIWRSAAVFFLSVWLWWQKPSPEWMWERRSSLNKGPLPFLLWRFVALVLLCGARRSSAVPFVKPPWRWSVRSGVAGETFFNKRILLWCGMISLLVFSFLSDHGGSEKGGIPAKSCSGGGDGGDLFKLELNHADNIFASVNPCRQGVNFSTSIAEASRTSRRSSTAPRRQVVHPRRLEDGQRLHFAGREPVSTLLLFLGGSAWRTPTSGGSNAQGLDHLENYCIRVFSVKWRSFSSNFRFLKARDERTSLQMLYLPQLME
jgi:hypothetical protein